MLIFLENGSWFAVADTEAEPDPNVDISSAVQDIQRRLKEMRVHMAYCSKIRPGPPLASSFACVRCARNCSCVWCARVSACGVRVSARECDACLCV